MRPLPWKLWCKKDRFDQGYIVLAGARGWDLSLLVFRRGRVKHKHFRNAETLAD